MSISSTILSRIAVSCIFSVNGFFYANWMARLPQFQEKYDMGNAVLGIVLLCHAIGALISMPLTGVLIARFNSKRITTVAGLSFVLMTPFFPLMPTVTYLGIWYGVLGMSSGMLDISMNDQAVLVERKMKKPVMSSFHGFFSLGMMIGAGAGILAINWELSLFQHLFFVMFFGLLLMLWSIRYLLIDPDFNANGDSNELFYWPRKSLVVIGTIAFCCMLGEGAMIDWSTIYMEEFTNANSILAPLGLAAFSGAMMVVRFIGDRIRGRMGDNRLLLSSSVMALVGLSLVLILPHEIISVLGFFLVGTGVATIVPIAYSIAGNTPNVPPGVGISMVTTIGYSGFLFGPPIIGFLAEWQSLRLGLLLVLFLFMIMSVLSWRRTVTLSLKSTQA